MAALSRKSQRDNYAIRGVAVKRSRQFVELDHNLNIERNNLHYICGRRFS